MQKEAKKMIDIHCHVLHGIDDGAADIGQAVELCSIAESQGITDIIVTPHFAEYDSVDEFVSLRDRKIDELIYALNEEEIELNIKAGCELYLDEMIFSAPDIDAVTLNGSRYMLCEFSLKSFDLDDALGWIDELLRRSYIPIIAHPERYATFLRMPEFINEFASRGVLFQINADSLTGGNGKSCFRLACDMLLNNLVDFIGSDAHSPRYRPNDLLTKSKYFPDFLENETLEKLLDENPALVLGDKKIILPERELIEL